MSNETDLDWLARNVHAWPAGDHQPWCYVYWKGGQRAVSGNCITVIQPCVRVEMSDWLARRAELQNKPSFSDHPDAKCFFQHENGVWSKNIESHDMGIDAIGWRNKYQSLRADYGWLDVGEGEVIGDWRDTLEKRPEQDDFATFVSVEDAQQELGELEMLAKVSHRISDKRHLITPSKYTKTIHGVSVDVYDVLQAWGVSNPALQHLIKKALQCGQRGHKDNAQDLQDIIDSAIRAKELG